eukprot:2672543-Rhodomonas_salina.2
MIAIGPPSASESLSHGTSSSCCQAQAQAQAHGIRDDSELGGRGWRGAGRRQDATGTGSVR